MSSAFSNTSKHFCPLGRDAMTWSSCSIEAVMSGAIRVRYLEYTSVRSSFISKRARLRMHEHTAHYQIKDNVLFPNAPPAARREREE